MKAIRYRITLIEPTLVASFGGAPDSVEAFDYLPGSVLRGVFIGKYLRANGGGELDIMDSETRRLFFDGSTRFLNGYPLDRLDNRMLPTPLSWRKKKDDESEIFDFSIDREEGEVKAISDPFCSLGSSDARLHQSERLLTIHTTRTRRFGRAMNTKKHKLQDDDAPGAVYRYDALAANQVFEAAILCDRDEDADLLKEFIKGDIFLGKSRSSGYGRASIKLCDPDDEWREAPPYDDAHDALILTLLSDTLLRDQNGSYTADACELQRLVSERLSVRLILRDAFVKSHIVGGFNRKWGLPLPQALALQAGSVLVFEADEAPAPEKLDALLWQGIGERRTEGFGRVGVNWHTYAQVKVDDIPRSRTLQTVEIKQDKSKRIAQRMLEQLLRKRLEEKLYGYVTRFDIKDAPHKSQLSRVRAVAQQALFGEPPDPQLVRTFLQNLRPKARRQFEKARVGSQSLLTWITESCNQDILQTLGFQEEEIPKLRTSDGTLTATISPKMKAEYTLRYIDAVLARAAKLKRGES
jgi:CRISPR-associated protein Csx10